MTGGHVREGVCARRHGEDESEVSCSPPYSDRKKKSQSDTLVESHSRFLVFNGFFSNVGFSIGSLLGCDADILELDVTDIKMDFP